MVVDARHAVAMECRLARESLSSQPFHQRRPYRAEVFIAFDNARTMLLHAAPSRGVPYQSIVAVVGPLRAAVDACLAFDAGVWIEHDEARSDDDLHGEAIRARDRRLSELDAVVRPALADFDLFEAYWRGCKPTNSATPIAPWTHPELRIVAQSLRLTGNQLIVVNAVAEREAVPLEELATLCGWDDAVKGFTDNQRHLNSKLRRTTNTTRWQIQRINNAATARQLPPATP